MTLRNLNIDDPHDYISSEGENQVAHAARPILSFHDQAARCTNEGFAWNLGETPWQPGDSLPRHAQGSGYLFSLEGIMPDPFNPSATSYEVWRWHSRNFLFEMRSRARLDSEFHLAMEEYYIWIWSPIGARDLEDG